MNLDEHHKIIIKELSLQGEKGQISYNQLFKQLKMNKKTFNKKLDELVTGNFVIRTPIKNKVFFKLSQIGKNRIAVIEIVTKFEETYQDRLNSLIEESFNNAEKKPLVNADLFLKSDTIDNSVSPVYTIAHLPSTDQAKKLIKQVKTEQERKDLGTQINQLIETYLRINNSPHGQACAKYLESRNVLFYMGVFPVDLTTKINESISQGIFKNSNQVLEAMLSFGMPLILGAINGSKEYIDNLENIPAENFKRRFIEDLKAIRQITKQKKV